ncbi:unnamed protein product [Strongylus vulgaris]|uniref:Uncharacterized protein n=1 Tax=Strongylus vulgaris TaxID=40348 RepID=A0A3P7ISE4_STRVU|nr:unnamed protein product [Strongylus vulgaris]
MALSQRMFPPAFLALGMVLPESCKFISSGTRMIRHRMDPGIIAKLLNHFGRTDEEELITHIHLNCTHVLKLGIRPNKTVRCYQ